MFKFYEVTEETLQWKDIKYFFLEPHNKYYSLSWKKKDFQMRGLVCTKPPRGDLKIDLPYINIAKTVNKKVQRFLKIIKDFFKLS